MGVSALEGTSQQKQCQNLYVPRRVFFSFHYSDVINFRANVVRNCGALSNSQVEFFDASLWEENRLKGASALRDLIDGGLDRTTVTTVLIGAQTAHRPWVRYEIAKSFARDNGLIGIHIHSIPDKAGNYGQQGPNPFDYLAYRINHEQNRVELLEWVGQEWTTYKPLPWFLMNGKGRKLLPTLDGALQLSKLVPTYTWDTAGSPRNFPTWLEDAAIAAGR